MILAVRRLFASLILTSVLFGTIGGGNLACAATPDDGYARGKDMPAMGMTHARAARSSERATGDVAASAHRPEHRASQEDRSSTDQDATPAGGHRCVPPAGCATLAHCSAVAVAPSDALATSRALRGARPLDVSASRPRGPAREPAFPPPRA